MQSQQQQLRWLHTHDYMMAWGREMYHYRSSLAGTPQSLQMQCFSHLAECIRLLDHTSNITAQDAGRADGSCRYTSLAAPDLEIDWVD
jgi:hypothetical protein